MVQLSNLVLALAGVAAVSALPQPVSTALLVVSSGTFPHPNLVPSHLLHVQSFHPIESRSWYPARLLDRLLLFLMHGSLY
ncbi:hypothetical protein BKA62DRAFT_718879, partial [Auriculariales sp. MPI-PUGE-AT-0066]